MTPKIDKSIEDWKESLTHYILNNIDCTYDDSLKMVNLILENLANKQENYFINGTSEQKPNGILKDL